MQYKLMKTRKPIMRERIVSSKIHYNKFVKGIKMVIFASVQF